MTFDQVMDAYSYLSLIAIGMIVVFTFGMATFHVMEHLKNRKSSEHE